MSRTATAKWKRLRKQVLYRAQQQGQFNCPHCLVQLDYSAGLHPNSAEVDHIVPYSLGGKDEASNCAVICATCNRSKGNREAPKKFGVQRRMPIKTSRVW